MSGLDDLNRAAEEARAQVREARDALAASRSARGGGPARNAREAERQLAALREVVADDVRTLRDRVTGKDPAAARALRIAALSTAGAIAGIVGVGVLGRSAVARGSDRRRIERQAIAVARALADQVHVASGAGDSRAGRSSASGSRRRGGGMLALAVIGAAVAGAVAVQQRRSAPVDPDDLWLPEETLGPA